MIDWRPRATALSTTLTTSGAITDPAWSSTFRDVPRHLFVPRFWALNEYNAVSHLIDGADPDQHTEWLDAVYSDRLLATQWAPGNGYRMITSSASLPSLVAAMLCLTDIHDDHRVLEIGTGTGYNTALLCHRVGAGNVTSIDIDPVLVAEAEGRLRLLGHEPTLVAGDGALGVKEGAPYDRILATCAVPGIQPSWIDQLAVGGMIVTPLTFGGALARLTKIDQDTVEGTFDAERAWFMPLRQAGQPVPDGFMIDIPDEPEAASLHHGLTDMKPTAFDDAGFMLWLSLHLPNARTVPIMDDGSTSSGIIIHTASNKATMRSALDGGPARISQDDRRLFDSVEAARHAWDRAGRPGRERIGMTAHANGVQRAWLDEPGSHHSWPLPV